MKACLASGLKCPWFNCFSWSFPRTNQARLCLSGAGSWIWPALNIQTILQSDAQRGQSHGLMIVVFHCLLTPCSGLKSVECLIDVDVSKIRMNYSTVEDHHDSPELLQYRADLPDDRQMYKLKMKLGRKAYRELLKGQRWGDSILGLFMLGYVFRMIWFVGLWRYCE